MKDNTRWVKLSQDFPQHPKMMAVSIPARWLFTEILCYCSRFLTDGEVSASAANALAMPIAIQTALPRVLTDALRGAMPEAMPEALPKAMREAMLKAVLKVMPTAMLDVEELADALLDELCTNDPDKPSLTSTETGFKVNDYLEYQTPKSDILARQKHGRKMAQARWGKKTDAKSNASSNASSNAVSNTKSNAEIEIEKEIDNYPLTPNGVSPQGGKRATQKKPRKTSRAKPLPPDWAPNPTHARIALEAGVNLDTEAEKFRDYLKASGKTYVDHDAAFRNWLRSPYRNNAGHAAPRYRTQADQLERMFQVAVASDAADQATPSSAEIFELPAPTGGDAA